MTLRASFRGYLDRLSRIPGSDRKPFASDDQPDRVGIHHIAVDSTNGGAGFGVKWQGPD
jgi:hypothetical protein